MSTTYRSKYTGEEIDALLRKEVQNISSINTIYSDPSELPSLSSAYNGTRYVALTNGALPLNIWSWDNASAAWQFVDQCRGSVLYVVLDKGIVHRFTNASPHIIPVSITKASQLDDMKTKTFKFTYDDGSTEMVEVYVKPAEV